MKALKKFLGVCMINKNNTILKNSTCSPLNKGCVVNTFDF